MSHPMFEKHQALLQQAVEAIATRGYWSPYPEGPRAYGETAIEDGRKAFEAYRNAQFYLDQPGVVGKAGGEVSPYGLPLNVSYPQCAPDALIAAAKAAMPAWIKAGPDARAGVCLEILARLNARSFEMAHAVMHTTGQPLMMAFQAAGPHAQDRGLEAVAYAWREMKHVPAVAIWEKPQGKNPPLKMEKKFTIMPRGVALNIACSTFPTWNGYPGLFASLVTGNPVIFKAHPTVILPLAITVAVARQVLKEAGFDANLVSLLIDDPQAPVAKDVAMKADIRLIDYTGGPDFGNWLEENCRHAVVYTEKAGVNCIVVDSTDDYKAMLKNLAFTFSLYSGQMCTTPQTVFVSREGVKTPDGVVSAEQFGHDLANAVSRFLEDPARAVEILGAIQSTATAARIEAAQELGEVLRPSSAVPHPQWPEARVRSPLILKVPVSNERAFMEERFGPISLVVETATTAESLATAERVVREQGAITFSLYSTSPVVVQLGEDAALRAGVALSINLTGGVFVNQSAGFSDFHATGANPAANACLTDSAFVANRFFVVQFAPSHLMVRVYQIDGVTPVVDPSAYVHPSAVLIGDVIVGPGSYIGPCASLRGDFGRLVVGAGANIQDCCVMHGFPGSDTIVEDEGHIGHGAILHGCIIRRNVLVGMNAVVMDNAVVGESAIVAAQSFIKAGMEIPPRMLAAGVPAKVMRELTEQEMAWKVEGTDVYKELARRSRATMKEVDALTAVEPDRRRMVLPDLKPLIDTKRDG